MDPDKRMYNFTTVELENSHLSTLAKQAGYPSLNAVCNEQSRWTDTAGKVEEFLRGKLEQVK